MSIGCSGPCPCPRGMARRWAVTSRRGTTGARSDQHFDRVDPTVLGAYLEEWAREESIAGLLSEAIRCSTRAREHYHARGDRLGESRVLAQMARYLEYDGRGREGDGYAAEAAEVLGPDPDGPALARALEAMAYVRMMRGEIEAVQVLVDRTLRAGGDTIDPLIRIRRQPPWHGLQHAPLPRWPRQPGRGAGAGDRRGSLVRGGARPREPGMGRQREPRCDDGRGLRPARHGDRRPPRDPVDGGRGTGPVREEPRTPGGLGRGHGPDPRASGVDGHPPHGVAAHRRVHRRSAGSTDADATLAEAWGLAHVAREFQRLAPAAIGLAEQAWITGRDDLPVEELESIVADGLSQGYRWSPGRICFWLWRLGL